MVVQDSKTTDEGSNLPKFTFRWLHISDIHHMVSADQKNMQQIFLQKLKDIFRKKENRIDCIVITGDFFQQGKCENDKLRTFLKVLYETCKEGNNWAESWESGNMFHRIFFCPGNHDLNRNASLNSEESEKWKTRTNVLNEQAVQSPDKMQHSDADAYKILTEQSFWLFDRIISSTIGYPDPDSLYKYEYNIFSGSRNHINPVIFVGLNTALYAGQTRDRNTIKSELAERRRAFEDADRELRYSGQNSALELYKDYVRLSQELTFGEVCDDGRLCFISEEASQKLSNQVKGLYNNARSSHGYAVIVFFGHHPLQALTGNARKIFAEFAKNDCFDAEVYLCGHEHRPKLKNEVVELIQSDPKRFLQSEVGGLFADGSEWNIGSFSIDQITFDQNGTAKLKETLFVWLRRFEKDAIDPSYRRNLKTMEYTWEDISLKEVEITSAETSIPIDRADTKIRPEGSEIEKAVDKKITPEGLEIEKAIDTKITPEGPEIEKAVGMKITAEGPEIEKVDGERQKTKPQDTSTQKESIADNYISKDTKKPPTQYPYDDIFNLPKEF